MLFAVTLVLAPPRRSAPAHPRGGSLAPARPGRTDALRAGRRRIASLAPGALGLALATALVAGPAAATPAPGSPAAVPPGPADSSPTPASTTSAEGPTAPAPAPSGGAAGKPAPGGETPPRVDGTYVGGTLGAGLSFARVNDFPTPDPFAGGAGTLRVGEVLYRWLSIGIEIAGNFGYRAADPRQRLLQGAFLVDFGFYPAKKLPLSLRAGFGAGGGAVREQGRSGRSGFGGAVFTGAVRYEFFPGADRRRPRRGGGFSLGPELGWIGFMPAAKGRPMAHTVYLGLFIGFYFGS